MCFGTNSKLVTVGSSLKNYQAKNEEKKKKGSWSQTVS